MGMLLDDPNGVADLDLYSYWETQLKNDKIILNQIDRAIAAFNQHLEDSGGVQEYTIDTGQDRQTVKRSDLSSLYSWRQNLVTEIDRIQKSLYTGNGLRQVVPGW